MNLNKKNVPQNNPKIGGETSQTEAGKRDKEMKEYQLKWTACEGKWSEAENSFIRGASKERKRKGTKQKPVKTKGAEDHQFVWSRRASRRRQKKKQTAFVSEDHHRIFDYGNA